MTYRRENIDGFLEDETQDAEYPSGHIDGHERHRDPLNFAEPVYLPVLREQRPGKQYGGKDPKQKDGRVCSVRLARLSRRLGQRGKEAEVGGTYAKGKGHSGFEGAKECAKAEKEENAVFEGFLVAVVEALCGRECGECREELRLELMDC